jgi:hypothetical protein
MKNLILGFLTLTTLSSFAVPAFSDEVNLQNVQQVSTQEGDMNRAYQNSSQTIRSSQNSRRGGTIDASSGNVQDLYQDTYQLGEGNMTRQTNIQEIRTRSGYRAR